MANLVLIVAFIDFPYQFLFYL